MKFYLTCIGAITYSILFLFFLVQGFTKYEDRRMSKIARQVSYHINNPAVYIRNIEYTLILEGTVSDEGERTRNQIIAESYLNGPNLRKLWQKPQFVDLTVVRNPQRSAASSK